MYKRWMIFLCVASICGESYDGGAAVDLSYSCVTTETTRHDLSPILLMHGLMGNKHFFDGIDEELAQQTSRMICKIDARNHGISPKTEEFSIDLMAADTIRLLDKLKFSKAILVGQSMGGKVAAVTALGYPDRVEKLLVEDMRPVSFTPEAMSWVKGSMQMMQMGIDAVPKGATKEEATGTIMQFFEEALKASNMEMNDAMKEKIKARINCNSGSCGLPIDIDFAQKVIDEPYWQTAPDGIYEGESLFIYGKISPFKVGDAVEEIRQRFPNAQLFGIEGANHDVQGDKPKEYLAAAVKFINGKRIKEEL